MIIPTASPLKVDHQKNCLHLQLRHTQSGHVIRSGLLCATKCINVIALYFRSWLFLVGNIPRWRKVLLVGRKWIFPSLICSISYSVFHSYILYFISHSVFHLRSVLHFVLCISFYILRFILQSVFHSYILYLILHYVFHSYILYFILHSVSHFILRI
jgi:hypothetical protein